MNQRTVLIIVAVSIITLSGLGLLPNEETEEVPEVPDYNVTLGFISATDRDLPRDTFLINLAENEINEYCIENGIKWRFNFNITCAEGQAQNAHDFTKGFAEDGVKLVGGYRWSSFLCSGARAIAADYTMTLFSIGSTSPLMAIPDTAFRLCPHDLKQVEPIIAMLSDFDVSSVIIIQRGDAWADGIVDEFKSMYSGTIVETIRYPAEITDLSAYLDKAQDAYSEYGSTEKPQVFLVSFSEGVSALAQLQDFPGLYNLTWFGTEGSADNIWYLEDAGEQSAQVKLLGPRLEVQTLTPDYARINELYWEEFNIDMDFYQANAYDCCWLMANLVIDTDSTDGFTLQSSVLEIAANHTGITGNLSLDENGDRVYAPYSIWGYFDVNGEYVSRVCGFYDPENDKITWDDSLIEIG